MLSVVVAIFIVDVEIGNVALIVLLVSVSASHQHFILLLSITVAKVSFLSDLGVYVFLRLGLFLIPVIRGLNQIRLF